MPGVRNRVRATSAIPAPKTSGSRPRLYAAFRPPLASGGEFHRAVEVKTDREHWVTRANACPWGRHRLYQPDGEALGLYRGHPLRHGLVDQVVSRRYEQKAIILTTNLSFKLMGHDFPGCTPCAVALIDRLTHHAEIVSIAGESYRKREAERSQKS